MTATIWFLPRLSGHALSGRSRVSCHGTPDSGVAFVFGVGAHAANAGAASRASGTPVARVPAMTSTTAPRAVQRRFTMRLLRGRGRARLGRPSAEDRLRRVVLAPVHVVLGQPGRVLIGLI